MTNTLIQPYLFFGGRCEEALDFYRSALGVQVDMLMLYRDSPEPPQPGMLQNDFQVRDRDADGNGISNEEFSLSSADEVIQDRRDCAFPS